MHDLNVVATINNFTELSDSNGWNRKWAPQVMKNQKDFIEELGFKVSWKANWV